MKGRMNTGLGEIVINPDVIALYAGALLWSASALSEWQR